MTASVSLRNSSYGAVGETRTRTIIRPLPPQDSVSANSTTTAWWALQDSNLRPIGYEPTALPAELRAHSGVPEEIRTPDTRLRRPLLYPAELLGQCLWREYPDLNRGIKVLQTCALPLGYTPFMGRSKGIEPSNVGATIRCVNHFATTAMLLAGTVGIEPTLEVLETSVLPLNYVPIVGCGDRI